MTNIFRRFDDWLSRKDKEATEAAFSVPEAKPTKADLLAEQVALAEGAKPEYAAKYAAEDTERAASYDFTAEITGEFLRIDVNDFSYLLRPADIERVTLCPGWPPTNNATAIATPTKWYPLNRYSSYIEHPYAYVSNFPAPSRDAKVYLVGPGIEFETPYTLGQTIYDRIVDALANQKDKPE